jgi:hypothetical protein
MNRVGMNRVTMSGHPCPISANARSALRLRMTPLTVLQGSG